MHLMIQQGDSTVYVDTLVTVLLLIGASYGLVRLLRDIWRSFVEEHDRDVLLRAALRDDRDSRRKDVDANGERVDP